MAYKATSVFLPKIDAAIDIRSDLDAFAAALAETRSTLDAALRRPGEISRYASRNALEASWRDSLAELQASFGRAEQHAQTLMRSIKIVFSLE